VLRLRLKDKHAKFLRELAGEVNFVWNYCNELQTTMFNRERRFLSGYDFAEFTRGATKEGLHLHSQTVQAVAQEYAVRRRILAMSAPPQSSRHRMPNQCSMRAGRRFERCSGISAISQVQRSQKPMKRFQPRPVLRAIRTVALKVSQVLE
jgi:hypothetical protein